MLASRNNDREVATGTRGVEWIYQEIAITEKKKRKKGRQVGVKEETIFLGGVCVFFV